MNIDDFLTYMRYELNRSDQTVESYNEDLRAFEAFFKSLDNSITWETVDSDVIRDWMEQMMDKGNTATTINRRLSALRSFYRYALAHGLIEKDPVHAITGPKKAKPLPQFLKEEEIDRLLDSDSWTDSYEDIRDRAIIMTFYETGMRLSELTGLDDEAVSFTNKEIKVLGKRNKERIIPFGDELSATLLHYRQERDSQINRICGAFFVADDGSRMQNEKVRYMVKKNLSKVCTLKKRTPHVLRHTFATAMLNHHAGLESLRKLLGHASLSTTDIYTHTTFEQLRQVYNEAHPRA